MRFWLHSFPTPGASVALARDVERWGFEGLLLADSQLIVSDPYAELVLCARETRSLRLGVAVTNPVTRDPSVTASSILTVHAESAGRAVLGFGRGDSALRSIGRRPASTDELASATHRLRGYLGSSGDDRTGLLAWASRDLPAVPIDLAATGPATIALAATEGDRVTVNLGADPEKLRWAVGVARRARTAAGLDPDGIPVGAYVNAFCSTDVDTAVENVRGSVSIFARFLAEGIAAGTPAGQDRSVVDGVVRSYEDARHGQTSAPQSSAEVLPREFVERFALVGPPDRLIQRIRELEEVGLDHLVIVPASRTVPADETHAATALFSAEVMPAFS